MWDPNVTASEIRLMSAEAQVSVLDGPCAVYRRQIHPPRPGTVSLIVATLQQSIENEGTSHDVIENKG